MGGGIDYDIRRIGLEDSPQALLVCYGNNLYREIKFVSILHLQFLLDIIGGVFVDIQNDYLLRCHSGYLPTKLGAYGSTATCNKDCLSSVVGVDLLIDDGFLASEQQVLYLELLQLWLLAP